MIRFKEFQEGNKEQYNAFFDKKLKKYGVSSPDELKGADKKKFYDEIDAEWESDDEEDGEKEKNEWKQAGEKNRRCAGGDGRRTRNKVVKSEEGCEDDEEEEMEEAVGYNSKQIEKACKKVGMSPAEVGDFFSALDGK